MAVNNTVSVKEYKLTGAGASTFPITFEFTTDDSGNAENIHCQFATKDEEGKYSNSYEIAQGMGTDQFQVEGGNVKYIDGEENLGKNNLIVIYRSTPPNQLTDFIDNGNYSLEDIEKALDKLTFILQERTGTPVGTYINIGVSLFFANILQLVTKKDFLDAIFSSWNDIQEADRPLVASEIREKIDAVARTGNNDIQGYNSFTHSPTTTDDISAAGSTAFSTKGYVDDKCATERAHTDAFFPVGAGNIADGNVTEAKIANGNVTAAKIADGNVTWGKIRKGSATVSSGTWNASLQRYVGGTWSSGGNKIPYALDGNATSTYATYTGGGMTLTLSSTRSTTTVYYIY